MQDLYHKYYLDNDAILKIMNEGILVFDSSALLDLYIYSEYSQNYIFNTVFPYFSDRLWIPAQVYFEFLKHKDKMSQKAVEQYKNLLIRDGKDIGYISKITKESDKIGKEELKSISGSLKALYEVTVSERKHPYVSDAESDIKQLNDAIAGMQEAVRKFQDAVNQFDNKITEKIEQRIAVVKGLPDRVQAAVENSFAIGKEYSYEKLSAIAREGAFRYSEKIPPGYMDANNKIGLQKYGDLILWMQVLDYARSNGKDILFVSNDVKEDWHDKESNAPRLELLEEFLSNTKKTFWSCSIANWLEYFRQLSGKESDEIAPVIEEVREIESHRKELTEEELMQIVGGSIFS